MTASTPQPVWTRDYAAFMRCDAGDDWLPKAAAQISGWLREKGFDASLTADQDVTAGGAQLTTRVLNDGDAHDLRIRLVEDGGRTGTWATDIVAHDAPGDDDWIHLTVTNSRGEFVAVPRIAKYLADTLPLRDGKLELSAEPQLFHVDDVDTLLELLTDDDRHALVLVAGSNTDATISFDHFRIGVAQWTREVAGLAQVIVLDPEATAVFAERVGERFAAPAWTIRSYQPGVDLRESATASRHRMMGTARLATHSIRRNQYLLGEIVRNHAGVRELPATVQRVRRRFERLEVRRLSAVEPEPPVVPDRGIAARAKKQVADLGLVKQFLRLEEITEAGLREIATKLARFAAQQRTLRRLEKQLEQFQSRIEELEDRDRAALVLLDDQQLETEVAHLDIDDRDARIRWLEARLKDKGDYEAQWSAVPEEFVEHRPHSFDELLDLIEECPGVRFTGDSSETIKLNAVDTNDAALRVAWDAVQTMRDYVQSRSNGHFSGSLDTFINNTPAGCRQFPPGKWAHQETAFTMQHWGEERVFPVPTSVAPAGRIAMEAHFKLARIGRKTPRMHVHDCHPIEPLVCIGYIGPHLTGAHTN